MHASLLLVSALGAAVWAAPTFPVVGMDATAPAGLSDVADYFNRLATKVQESRLLAAAPVCDLSRAVLPASTLPPVTAGLGLKHIAIGRGTQNYTCDPSKPTDAPKAIGAVATLFNASCLVATNPDLAASLARAALRFDLPQSQAAQKLVPSNLDVSGRHFFLGDGTPFFDLDLAPQWQIGELPCGKNGSAPAPPDAAKGPNGEAAVSWLKLVAKPGATGGLQEVYRVQTSGGSAPATCAGQPASFEVQYSAEYWFFAK